MLNLDKSFHEATVAHKTQIASILSPYFAPFYSYVAQAENASGLDNALIMYLTFFVISYPLAFVHRNLPSGAPRHVYSLTLGLLFCFLMFQWQALNAVIVPIVALLIMYFAPRQQVQKITFVWSFGYLILWYVCISQTLTQQSHLSHDCLIRSGLVIRFFHTTNDDHTQSYFCWIQLL